MVTDKRCFHIPRSQISGNQVRITGRELHHLMDVVRLREGDRITVLDGVGGIYEVILASLTRDIAIGEIRGHHRVQPSDMEVTLVVGLPKADKMDMIVQKATELGAHRIVPASCQRSVPHLQSQRVERRIARWRQISVEASKQSRRPFFPIISELINFDITLEEVRTDLKLIFVPNDLFTSPEKLKHVLGQNAGAKKMSIFIGPEGGFTEDEVSQAVSVGAIPVVLGSNILRTETAAIAALAIVLYERDVGYSKQDA